MFDEKYGDVVRVVSFGHFSKELCGGTHVSQSGDIGLIKITSESAIAAGIRRLEFLAGEKAYRYVTQREMELLRTAGALKVSPMEVVERTQKTLDELKERDKRIRELEKQLVSLTVDRILKDKTPYQLAETFVYMDEAPVSSPDTLKLFVETLQERVPSSIILTGIRTGEKVALASAVSKDQIEKGFKAGDLVKQAATVCGGGGGGNAAFAQAGGKDPNKLQDALAQAKAMIQQRLLKNQPVN